MNVFIDSHVAHFKKRSHNLKKNAQCECNLSTSLNFQHKHSKTIHAFFNEQLWCL